MCPMKVEMLLLLLGFKYKIFQDHQKMWPKKNVPNFRKKNILGKAYKANTTEFHSGPDKKKSTNFWHFLAFFATKFSVFFIFLGTFFFRSITFLILIGFSY